MRIALSMSIVWILTGCSVYGQTEPPPPPTQPYPPVYGEPQPQPYPPGYGQPQPPPTTGPTDQPPPVPGQEQPEVLTSGPVHEAFAEPVNLQDQQGLEVQQQPPPVIQETPPLDRPQGDQYNWVPGYWAWDPDRNGYVWVSACWRAAPPNTYWVPGYWARTTGGWVWVPGFWAPMATRQIQYLPPPPAYTDVQPPGPPPSEDVVWVPPCPYWYQDHYVRREGYWVRQQQGWIWTPTHYIWTPRGYAFVEGHWDYSLNRRGVLFAPAYFPQPYALPVGYVYTPSIVIDIGALQVNLFTYPRYCHYYFGDYYNESFLNIGIYPWFEWQQRHTWYDPIFTYDEWRYRRTNPRWADDERREYERRRTDRDLRPPRTYRELETRVNRAPEGERRNIEMARPLSAAAATRGGPVTFQRIDRNEQRRIATQSANTQRYRQERHEWESTAVGGRTVPRTGEQRQPAPTPAPRPEQRRVMPPPERAQPAPTPTPERVQPTPPPQRGPTPQAEQRATPTPAPERTQPTPTPQPERRGPTAAPEQTRPGGTTAPTAAQRPVPVTRPETVNVPRSPITARPAARGTPEASPPPRPSEERQGARGERGRGSQGGNRGEGRNQNR